MKTKLIPLSIVCFIFAGFFLYFNSINSLVITSANADAHDTHEEVQGDHQPEPDTWEARLIPKDVYPDWERESITPPAIPMVDEVKKESSIERSMRFRKEKIGYSDIIQTVMNLEGNTILTDQYKPVRFMMREHSTRMNGDCASCHHKTPASPIKGISAREMETLSCEACHQESQVITSQTDRLGLKAAYHNRCISCHEEKTDTKAPVNCKGCHNQNVPDHSTLFDVEGEAEKVTPHQVTALCLECHPGAGKEMIESAHYQWGGPVSEWTTLSEDHTMTGKSINSINNNCISPFADWGPCTKCHTGYGLREKSGKFSENPLNIDCLSCHAAEDTYGKKANGMPQDDVDLVWTAELVGSPVRSNCGACHYNAGGGNGRKGTMHNALNAPDRSLDVHMGGTFNMVCADCHKSKQHKIAGRHSSVGVDEGIVECTDCHADKPHAGKQMATHIDRHVSSVKCSTCHIPNYSRNQWSRYHWDWRSVGKGDKIIRDEKSGKPIYLPDEGHFKWAKNIKPHYSWDNNHTQRYLIGDNIDDLSETVYLSKNIGSYEDPASKIGPFKRFTGWQPADTQYNYLLVPKNAGEEGIWETKDWEEPLRLGMADVGLPFSGEYTFVPTELRFRPRHEVAPKEKALTCTQCHSKPFADVKTAEKNCAACHKTVNQKGLGYVMKNSKNKEKDYLDWDALGYKNDPVVTGGRFSKK